MYRAEVAPRYRWLLETEPPWRSRATARRRTLRRRAERRLAEQRKGIR